jgi:hypothetical protein
MFTTDFNVLCEDDVWTIEPSIETTTKTFMISAPTSDETAHLYIREDGYLWKE